MKIGESIMKELDYDKLMHIKTGDLKNQPSVRLFQYHRYEPTPYSALEVLFEHYEVSRSDHIVDFGCGLGRLNFYIHHFYHASVTGIEMNKDFHEMAMENLENYQKKMKGHPDQIQFYHCLAEEYDIKESDNRFYFFNPFSIHIFRKIVHKILGSLEQNWREADIILYYGHDDYVQFLENETPFEVLKEVKIPELYERNPYERFLIYRVAG